VASGLAPDMYPTECAIGRCPSGHLLQLVLATSLTRCDECRYDQGCSTRIYRCDRQCPYSACEQCMARVQQLQDSRIASSRGAHSGGAGRLFSAIEFSLSMVVLTLMTAGLAYVAELGSSAAI
jgi:hypothetical protein